MLQTAPVTIAEQNYKNAAAANRFEALRSFRTHARTTLERARPQALRGAAAHPDQALQGLRPVCAQAIPGSTDATGLGHEATAPAGLAGHWARRLAGAVPEEGTAGGGRRGRSKPDWQRSRRRRRRQMRVHV